MRKSVGLFMAILISTFAFAQSLGVKWSRPAGGSSSETGREILKTPDGGYIGIADTYSNNIDVSGNHGNVDMWVFKINASGGIEWQKCLGGSSSDNYRRMLYSSDGNVLILGITYSNNGDVSGNHGGGDIWAVKMSTGGNILWKKCLGGTDLEEFRSVDIVNDGGFIITGYTSSNDGDVSGNHGGEDIWLLKLASTGAIEWQKCLGGSSSERPRFVKSVDDGNIVVVGSTSSSNGDVTGQHGSSDLWVIKLNALGNIIWQKAYGGSNFESGFKAIVSSANDLTVLANTYSNDGDVVGYNAPSLDADTWILNLNYNNGNINWQRCIGGTRHEQPVDLMPDADGKYLVASQTSSKDNDAITNRGQEDILFSRINQDGSLSWSKCFGGSKNENLNGVLNDTLTRSFLFVANTVSSNVDVTGYHQNAANPDTLSDAWIGKVNYAGNLEWQRCFGGTNSDNLFNIKHLGTNNFILIGETSSNDGDLKEYRGNIDVWVIQLGPVNTIKGTIFIDRNLNGIKDNTEPYYSGAFLKSKKATDSVVSVSYNGLFMNEVDTGIYITSLVLTNSYYNIIPTTKQSVLSSYFNVDSISFALQPIPDKKDLSINLFPLEVARPGFPTSYKIVYQNKGTTMVPAGEVIFQKDPRLTLVSTAPAYNSINGDQLQWNYSNLQPGDSASITIKLTVQPPPAVSINDTLKSTAFIDPVSGDETPADDTSILKQLVIGSYDPNDKYENNGGVVSPDVVVRGEFLNYIIRFQNMGTDTAFTVVVRDTLDSRLNWNTFQMIASSHNYRLAIEGGNKLVWTFNDIKLPHEGINEPASHGFIAYRIRPNSNVPLNDTIHNLASIYFDFNLPVVTNDAFTVVRNPFTVLPAHLVSFTGHLNGKVVNLQWEVGEGKDIDRFEVERSTNGRNFSKIGSVMSTASGKYMFGNDISGITSGQIFYRLKLINSDGTFIYSKVLPFRLDHVATTLLLYPNPMDKEGFVSFNAVKSGRAQFQIFDDNGKNIVNYYRNLEKGKNVILFNTSLLANGSYIIKVTNGDQSSAAKFKVVH